MASSAPPKLRDPLPADSRYECLVKIASGGMASVYVGRLRGAVGFWRLVAVKRAHAHLLEDPVFRRLLVAEARLASKIHHPNVVAVQDVEELEQELLLVMDYVEGAALSELNGVSANVSGGILPTSVVLRMAVDACHGLQAVHELTDESGAPLGLVHRDVSPQNLLVGVDGVTRIADFGIAKCALSGASSATTTGALKGKVAYMSPEYIEGDDLDARSDIFALGVVLWEAFTGQRLFRGPTEVDTLRRVVDQPAPKLSSVVPRLAPLDAIIAKAVEKAPSRRFRSARELGEALEEVARQRQMLASYGHVGATVRSLVGPELEQRRERVREFLARSTDGPLRGARSVEVFDEDAPIHVTFTDTPMAAAHTQAVVPETSTLGSSVSSRRILLGRAAKNRARRRRIFAGLAVAAAGLSGFFAWRLMLHGTPVPGQVPDVAAPAPPNAASHEETLPSLPATASPPPLPPAGAETRTEPAAPTSSGAAALPVTAAAPAKRSRRNAAVKPAPRPSDPSLAPPAPNPYAK